MTVTWSEIEAECGDYRAGFIATFRKYEGGLTDEKDGQGRTVKVTASSFARHMGIGETTFKRWLKQEGRGGRPDQRDRTAEVLRDPERRRKVIAALDPEDRAEIVREVSRAGDPPPMPEREVDLPDLAEVTAADLTAQVSKLVHTASRIDVLLADHGALFRRIDADEAARLDDDLERAVKTIRAVRAELLKHREIEVQA